MKYCSLITVVCFALINPEVASSQDWPPLQITKGVGPPLICPSSFQLKGIVSPQGGGCASWSDHLKPPQGQPRLAPHCTHWQGLPEEWSGQRNLRLLTPHLASPPHLRSSISYPWYGKVMDEGVQVVGCFTKGSNNNAVDPAKRSKLALHRPDCALDCSTVSLICLFRLGQVLGVELSRPLVFWGK